MAGTVRGSTATAIGVGDGAVAGTVRGSMATIVGPIAIGAGDTAAGGGGKT